MSEPRKSWRVVQRPLQACVRKGWTWGRQSLISPRGTVFEVRRTPAGLLARARKDFQLKGD